MSSSTDFTQYQDLQLLNALNDLKRDPTALQNFMNANKSQLYNGITSEHSDSFQKVYNSMIESSNSTKNTLYYAVRNKDLDSVQNLMLDNVTGLAENAAFDNQVARRQFEINEWTNGNKMDTLFFMQLLFIYLTFTVPLLYANKAGFLPSSVFYGIAGLLTFALIMTVVVRAQYTNKIRDAHSWNRRRFNAMGGPPPSLKCADINAAIEDTLNRGNTFKKNFNAAVDETMNDAATYGNTIENSMSKASSRMEKLF
jgi:hypothetical protein